MYRLLIFINLSNSSNDYVYLLFVQFLYINFCILKKKYFLTLHTRMHRIYIPLRI